MTDADGDGIHSVTVDLPLGDFEYKYAVDGFAGQEDLIDDMVNGGTCAPITDYYSYANRQFNVNLDYTYGNEQVTNGDFSADGADWNLRNNWLVVGGIAYSSGVSSNPLEQTSWSPTAGAMYTVTYDVGALSQGTYQVSLGGALGEERTALGTYTETIMTTSTSPLMIVANGNAIGAVDNVSVIEITNIASGSLMTHMVRVRLK